MMLRRLKRILVLTLALSSIGGVSYAQSRINWGQRWELTPLEHKRLRAKGLNDQEVFAVATIAEKTGYDVDYLVNGIFRGVTLQMAALRLGMLATDLTVRRPEWGTPAWEEAVKWGEPSFHGPYPPPPPAPPK